jgi:hypothetical protein
MFARTHCRARTRSRLPMFGPVDEPAVGPDDHRKLGVPAERTGPDVQAQAVLADRTVIANREPGLSCAFADRICGDASPICPKSRTPSHYSGGRGAVLHEVGTRRQRGLPARHRTGRRRRRRDYRRAASTLADTSAMEWHEPTPATPATPTSIKASNQESPPPCPPSTTPPAPLPRRTPTH